MVKLEEFTSYWKKNVHDKMIRVAKDMGLYHQLRQILQPQSYNLSRQCHKRDFYFLHPLYNVTAKKIWHDRGVKGLRDVIDLEKGYGIKHKFTYNSASSFNIYMCLMSIIIISKAMDCTPNEQDEFVRRCHSELFNEKRFFFDNIFSKFDVFIHKLAW